MLQTNEERSKAAPAMPPSPDDRQVAPWLHCVNGCFTEVLVEGGGGEWPLLMSPSNRTMEISQDLALLWRCHWMQVSGVNSGKAEAA